MNYINAKQAVSTLARIYHSDLAQRSPIIGMLVSEGIIEKPVPRREPRAPCPPLSSIKAFKVSFFDNGETSMGYRGVQSPLKREFGLQLHAWTDAANVRSDRHANWSTTVPLWDRDFAIGHLRALHAKRQICDATANSMATAIADFGASRFYGLAFGRGQGSGWLKGHAVLAKIENRIPADVAFGWGGDIIQADLFTNLSVDQKPMTIRGGRAIYHARIAFTDEHAEWANDVRISSTEVE